MASANLKSKISLDDTQFSAGLRRVKLTSAAAAKQIGTSFRKLGSVMANLVKSLARFAAIAGAITFAAAVAGAVKLGGALKKAFDAGGALSDLSAQTGIAVKQLVILQQAFKDNGLSADQAGSTINKLQRSISDFGAGLSTQVRAFERLGISFDQLEQKSPLEQFQMVQAAISKMENPTQKAATAMEIFGRSGGDMLALFADGNAIDNAMVTVGSAADLLDKNATKFDRISDLLGSAGSKLQGFFVGIADVAADKILPVLEKFNSIDFAAMGQNFAQNFDLQDIFNGLKMGFDVAAKFLQVAVIKALTKAMSLGLEIWKQGLNDSLQKFVKGLENGLMQVIAMMASPFFMLKAGVDGFRGGKTSIDNSVSPAMQRLLDGVADSEKDLAVAIADLKEFLKPLGSTSSAKTDAQVSTKSPTLTGNGHGMVLADSAAGRALQATFENPFAKNKQVGPIIPPTPISPMQATAMQMSTAAGAGFTGLAGLHGMQLERMAGIGPGSNTTFARDRKRLGIASGLQTGGLGAVRKVGAKADQKQQRKDDTVIGTNERLTTVNEKLEKQNEMLQEALN